MSLITKIISTFKQVGLNEAGENFNIKLTWTSYTKDYNNRENVK